MRKVLCLSLVFGLLIGEVFANEAKIPVAEPAQIDLFSYSSDRCKDIKDSAELYNIAISLRDSKDAKDQIDAVDCMIGSAFRGYGLAEYELARMYSVGSIVPQSNIFAYRWAELAVMDGYPDAKDLRDRLEADLTAEELDTAFEQAKKVYQERNDTSGVGSNRNYNTRTRVNTRRNTRARY